MKAHKVISTIIMTATVLMATSAGHAQTNSINLPEYQPKSPENATQYSVMGVVIPIVAGIAWWRLDKPEVQYEIHSYWGEDYTYTKYDDPDRMIPVMLVLSGIFLGPSTGYFYGGCPGKGVKGILVRAGTGAFILMIASEAASSAESGQTLDYSGMAAGVAVAGVGSLVILAEALYDISKVKSVVAENNVKKAQQRGANATLLPTYFADSGAAGLRLNVTF